MSLHSLCHDGNLYEVKEFMEQLKDEEVAEKLANGKGVLGYTPLHEATASGHQNVVEFLLEKTDGALVNCRTVGGYTPLHIAANNGHEQCVEVLLYHGADISITGENGMTPKEMSSKRSIVRLLHSEEIVLEVKNNGGNLIALLQFDPDLVEQNCLNRALAAATDNDNHLDVEQLIVSGANNIEDCLKHSRDYCKPHARAMLLLIKAAMQGDHKLVLKLFGEPTPRLDTQQYQDNGFKDVQKAVLSGQLSIAYPIEIARKNGHIQVCEKLLLKTNVNGKEGSLNWDGLQLMVLDASWLRKIYWVKHLQLARNGFKELPNEMGTYLKQVVKLDLQHNKLQTIPSGILELPSLSQLNLSHNKLLEIPDIPEWSPSLTVLDLSHNQLASMPLNVIATYIQSLNVSYNMFQTVPLCICSFTTLHELDISYNPDIQSLPAEMGRLTNLTRLYLKGLINLNDPHADVQLDMRDCIHYLRSKLRCAKGFFHMKLMLLGFANQGKTTLVSRLLERYCGNDSTVEVDISEWIHKPSQKEKRFYFSIWDFGGQDEYCATYQCFLTHHSLYLLLFNLTDGMEGVQELKPWLNNLSLRAPHSMVIIIGTHLDQVADDERDEVTHLLHEVGKLASSYKKLQGVKVIPVGLKNYIENIGLLKKAIYRHASTYKNQGRRLIMGQKIPASYHTLHEKLKKLQEEVRNGLHKPIMHSKEFKLMVQQMFLADIQDDDELKSATLFLTDVGSLLHYDERSHNLHELYFIDICWLYNMMSKLVNIKAINPYMKKGVLYSKDISLIFKDEQFPWEYFKQILTLLDRFEVALPINNSCLLIPSMLPTDRPSTLKHPLEALQYTRYIMFSSADILPGFWSRLLSRVMNSVEQVSYALDQRNLQEIDSTTTCNSNGSVPIAPTIQIHCLFPNVPTSLFMGLEKSHNASDIHLEYWHTGLFYSDPDLMFYIEYFGGSIRERKEGIVIKASLNSQGKKIIGQLVDLIVSVSEWYQDLYHIAIGLEQKVPCHKCQMYGRAKPFEFEVEKCLPVIAKNQMNMECEYFHDNPTRNHTVPLTDIVPDLLLQDINPDFLLNAEDVSYSEDECSLLGKGGYGKVYQGKYLGKSVAIKRYFTYSKQAFHELRTEAMLLQKAHHPCLVGLVGVCLHPMIALVMEKAPLGSLEKFLIKQKDAIHRLTIFRMAAQVAAALWFLHIRSVIFRDLKAANVLLWTLDPESLFHCKLTDFGTATPLSPSGARGLIGTNGFMAPEVIYIGRRKQRSVYDHKADIFSFGMLLYQMIARRNPYHDISPHRIQYAVKTKKRPKLQDVYVANSEYHYLTRLMQICWEDNPHNRPTADDIVNKICLSPMQAVMCVHPISSKVSLHQICAITPYDFIQAGVTCSHSELWVFCDGAEGAEVNIYNKNTMIQISNNFIKDKQIQCVCLCGDHVWLSSQTSIEYSMIDVFSITTREKVCNIHMRENSVTCITSSGKMVYLGTLEGFCFLFFKDVKKIQANPRSRYKYVSEDRIDGIACTMQCVWVSHTHYINFLNLDNLGPEGSIHRQRKCDAYIGQLTLSADCSTVWSAHLGGVTLSAWDACQKRHKFDINMTKHMKGITESLSENDIVITAMTTAVDNVWVGMASGHILLFHEDALLTWYHPYSEYVRCLYCISCTGPCDTEQWMVISGAKGFHSEKLVPRTRMEEYDDKLEVLVLWEAYSSRTTRQIKLLEEHSNSYLDSHDSVRRMILEGGFIDGTHIFKPLKETQDLTASTLVNTEGLENTDTIDASVSQSAKMPNLYDIYTNRHLSTNSEMVGTSHTTFLQLQETLDVKLPTNDIVQVSCPKPVKLKVLLSELQVNTGLDEDQCKIEYCKLKGEGDSIECIKVQTQEQLDKYLQTENRPQLYLSRVQLFDRFC